MAYELLGKNFTPPDIQAKVTGKAKYAEDFRVDGMVFCKLLTSPMPHARVTSIDPSEALAMPGVLGVLTADEVPSFPEPSETILTNEPVFVGHPILAIAAETEELAADALEKIKIVYEELPFTVDPLQSLYPGGPDARTTGNIANPGIDTKRFKWTARDFAAAADGQMPMGEPVREWSFGDVEAGLAEREARARRVVRDARPVAPLDRVAHRARVLAERQVSSARARRRARACPCRASRASSASSRRSSCSSRSSAAAGSARRAAPIR